MIIELKQRFSQYKFFWKIQRRYRLIKFEVAKRYYQLREFAVKVSSMRAFIFNMFKNSLPYFVLPMLIAFLTQAMEEPLRPWFVNKGWVVLRDTDYSTLVATVTSISGLFIGLYYTAITSISGAIYSKLPQSLRQLLFNESLGKNYLKYLVFFTFLGILFLTQYVLGYRVNPLNVPIITILAGFAVFAFYQLGVRVLSLFEPTKLSNEIFINIHKSVKNVLPGNKNWKVGEFQKHERNIVQYWLESIDALAELSTTEKHLSGKVFLKFVNEITHFLCWYEYNKDKIPRSSEWFKSKLEHPNWYKSTDTVTTLAFQFSHTLQPTMVRDYRWLENELSKVLLSCLETNLNADKYEFADGTLTNIKTYVETISKKGDITWALSVIELTANIVAKHINVICKKSSDQNENLTGICDAVAALPTNCFLAFKQGLDQRHGSRIKDFVKKREWRRSNFIYEIPLSENTIKKLEWLSERLMFEYQIEKKYITPDWYILDEVCREEELSFTKNLDLITNEVGKLYKGWVGNLIAAKRFWLASTCIIREKEFWSKFSYQRPELDEYLNSLLAHKNDENQWSDFDLNIIFGIVEGRLTTIQDINEVVLKGLLPYNRPVNFPDYHGLLLHSLGESVFQALINNETEKAEKQYRTYFWVSFYKFSELISEKYKHAWQSENQLRIASTALIDLFDLTGYGLVLSKFNKNKRLELFIGRVWEHYFNEDLGRFGQVLATVNYFDSFHGLGNRWDHRFNWKNTINLKLSSEIETKEISISTRYFHTEQIKLHDDPVVRLFACKPRDFNREGVDFFATEVIVPKLGAEGERLVNIRRDLTNDILREKEKYSTYIKGLSDAE
ncbi:hypothetical protein WNY79_13185 [Pseudoalteromonas sp. AS84]|uniref:hypothetical protein n=1 Tax=Pseudoalteromonas sp. AS84 TaxID=3135778 RepID=UPI00316B9C7E